MSHRWQCIPETMPHVALLKSPQACQSQVEGDVTLRMPGNQPLCCVSVRKTRWTAATTPNPWNSSPAELMRTTGPKGFDLKRGGKRWGTHHAWASARNLTASSRRQEWAPSPHMTPEGCTLSWGEGVRPGAAFSPWLDSLPIHWLLPRAQRTQMDTGYRWRAAPDGGQRKAEPPSWKLGVVTKGPSHNHDWQTYWPVWPPSPHPSFPRAGSEST